MRGLSKFYKFVRFKKNNQQTSTKHTHIIWNCIPLISWWRQLSKKCFLNTSNPSFCYWKKLCCMTQLCLDQLFGLQLKNYINESCHSFMLFFHWFNPANINKMNNFANLRWKTCLNTSDLEKAKTKHKTLSNWPVSLWVLVCDPIQNVPWAEKQRKAQVGEKFVPVSFNWNIHAFISITYFLWKNRFAFTIYFTQLLAL